MGAWASSESFYLEHELRQNGQNKQFNYSATKLGLTSWSQALALRGSLEILSPDSKLVNSGSEPQEGKDKLYYELAAEVQLADFRFIPSAALGSDARYRADSSYQMEARYTGFGKVWPFLASVREQYETTATSTYLYNRAGAYILLPYAGLILNFYGQAIDLELEGQTGNRSRQGSGQLLGLSYYGSEWNSGVSAQRSCLSKNYLCNGENQDYYSEYSAKTEYLFLKNWSLGSSVGMIEQKAEFQDPALATISSDAKYFKFLLRIHL